MAHTKIGLNSKSIRNSGWALAFDPLCIYYFISLFSIDNVVVDTIMISVVIKDLKVLLSSGN